MLPHLFRQGETLLGEMTRQSCGFCPPASIEGRWCREGIARRVTACLVIPQLCDTQRGGDAGAEVDGRFHELIAVSAGDAASICSSDFPAASRSAIAWSHGT